MATRINPPDEARWLRAETAREGGRGKPSNTQKGKERIALMLHKYAQGTWLEPEEAAYPHGGQSRRGLAVWPDGKKRRVYAGVPDTWFSIPAHGKLYRDGRKVYIGGFLTVDDDGTLRFHAMEKYSHYFASRQKA